MKKFLITSILAMTVAALSTQEAPAWLNWKFGVGMNFGWQSGGNNTLWGLFRNGQPPAPDACGGGGGMLPPGPVGPGPGPGYFPPTSLERPTASATDAQATVNRTSYATTPGQAYYGQMVNYTYNTYPYYYNYGYNYARR